MQRYIQLTTEQYQQIDVLCPVDEGLLSFNLTPLPCYAPLLLEFIRVFSHELSLLERVPSARALGFFLRERVLHHQIEQRLAQGTRSPLGVSFHLVPANVPMVAFHSALASLLQGNPTIVRLSSRELPDQQAVISVLNRLLAQPRWQMVADRLRIIRYPHDERLTQSLSDYCASRVLWGGDQSIAAIRRLPLPAGAKELTFADRQSLALFDEAALRELPARAIQLQLQQLAVDIGQFDQQSCSSPGLLLWVGRDTTMRQRVFCQLASFLPDELKRASEQLLQLQQAAIDGAISHYQQADGIGWGELSWDAPLPVHRGGTLYWQQVERLETWLETVANYQTCVMVGGSRQNLRDQLLASPSLRVDRVVAPGQALAFDWYWDGVDLLSELSRAQR